MRSGYRRLSKLTIPRDGSDLELESAATPNVEKTGLIEGLKWVFAGGTEKRRLPIPREMVVAVQLCPWKFAVVRSADRSTTWGVQGLLVLASPESTEYHRLPLLLTGDFVGAARLMSALTRTMQVPYLFCADAAGWEAETMRATSRPPLHVGGIQS